MITVWPCFTGMLKCIFGIDAMRRDPFQNSERHGRGDRQYWLQKRIFMRRVCRDCSV